MQKDFLLETLELNTAINYSSVEMGRRLYEIKRDELWKGHNTDYLEFLTQLDMHETKDYKLRKIYSTLVLDYGLSPEKLSQCIFSNLYKLASKIKDKQTATELLESAMEMPRQDFNALIREKTEGEHECVESERLILAKCGICKKTWRLE